MFHVVISDSIYWMKVEIWGDEKNLAKGALQRSNGKDQGAEGPPK